MDKIDCPKCGKTLIKLEPDDDFTCDEFYCDNCEITILIYEEKEIG